MESRREVADMGRLAVTRSVEAVETVVNGAGVVAGHLKNIDLGRPSVVRRQEPKSRQQAVAVRQFGADFPISVSLGKGAVSRKEARGIRHVADIRTYRWTRRLGTDRQDPVGFREWIDPEWF